MSHDDELGVRAEQARDLAAATLAPIGLRLHPDKTRIVCLRQGEEGFDFLGFHHRVVKSHNYRGRLDADSERG